MTIDYRKLCLEFFGTDDVEQLREISHIINKKNPRNAGRKKQFTTKDIDNIRTLLDNDMSINEIADHYGTSRQIVSKYIHAVPKRDKNCTLRISYMYKNRTCTIIDVDFLNEKIVIENQTNDLLRRAFGIIETPTWEDFEYFLEDRCFPKTRGNAKDILKALGLDSYDPLQIVEKTEGRMADDDMWMKFTYFEREDVNND